MPSDEAAFQRKVNEYRARAKVAAGPPEPGDDRPVRWREHTEQALFMRDVIKDYVDREIAERDKKIAALEKEIDELHKSSAEGLKYCGIFNKSQVYERNHMVTHGSQLWFCL